MSNYISTSEVFLLSLIEEYLHKHDDDDDLNGRHFQVAEHKMARLVYT